MAKYDYLEIGVHLHSRPEHAAAKILAAYDAGCRRFDSAIGGLGGCPFAQDALVGNIATEKVIETLKQRGAELPPLKPLDTLLRATAEMGARYTNYASMTIRRPPDMNYKTIQLAYDSGVATITLNRPDKRNAISFELIDDLLRALKEVENSDAHRAHRDRRRQSFLFRHGPGQSESAARAHARAEPARFGDDGPACSARSTNFPRSLSRR